MKILKWIMKALVAFVTIITLIVLFADELEHTYSKLTWTPPMEINGITIGMTRSDVVFKLGEPIGCKNDNRNCYWDAPRVGIHEKDMVSKLDGAETCDAKCYVDANVYRVSFENESAIYQSVSKLFHLFPFKDTQGMKSLLGDEDILAESKDFNVRRYTYLKWGTSFVFENDSLNRYAIGQVTWRPTSGPVGKYIVKGTVACPGTECPFDDEGAVKEDFKDRDYTYFIK